MRAFLLAAGRGVRAGGPKAWLPYDGATLLERQLSFLLSRFHPDQVVVTIQADWMERCRALNTTVHWLPVDPDAPAFASLRAVMDIVTREDWSFVYHVDQPVWEPELFDLLASAAGETAADAVAPRFQGRRGHPILLSPAAHAALLKVDPLAGRLDRWLEGRRVHEVEVPFSCVRENWNEGAPRPA